MASPSFIARSWYAARRAPKQGATRPDDRSARLPPELAARQRENYERYRDADRKRVA
jgi:hypothetical protein